MKSGEGLAGERGIVLIDKPSTLTSMQCVEDAKARLGARKAGHSGTLDPKVTGLMLIAINEATKAMPAFSGLDKAYTGTMEVHGDVSRQDIERVFRSFTGRLIQVPPKRSAVVRQPREREIFSLELLELRSRRASFRVTCEAGTYIRKLCHDIGEALGTGGHMTSLRRTGIGPFKIKEACTLGNLSHASVIPLEDAVKRVGLQSFTLDQAGLASLIQGMPVEAAGLRDGLAAALDASGMVAALASFREGKLRPERIIF
jgi:H/ACA ribonucleoprotein complex subunit 4